MKTNTNSKRFQVLAIMRRLKITSTSSWEKRSAAADVIVKEVPDMDRATALHYMNWILRNGNHCKKLKASKAA